MLTYKYYDTPEGHDIYKKTFVLSKYAALTGVTLGTIDVLMYSHPKGIFNTAFRYMWYIGPMVGMASAFALTTNVSQHIRGKNDHINYVLGGLASGSIFGAWVRSPVAAVPMGVVLAAAAFIKKSAVDEGWVLFPKVTFMNNSITSVRNDWTLVKDIDELKTWSKGTN